MTMFPKLALPCTLAAITVRTRLRLLTDLADSIEANGYFNAYGNAARKDKVDYVLHLGDYIYETGKGTLGKDPRATNPSGTIFTLYEYRTRIAQYRTDPDLVLSHGQFPWIPVWDDHEVGKRPYSRGVPHASRVSIKFECCSRIKAPTDDLSR
jgi:phosphodiesterase/alkaline phosphatase D-like protein